MQRSNAAFPRILHEGTHRITNPPKSVTVRFLDDLSKRVDIAADEQQQQIDALERLVLNRAALVNIEQDGRKVHFTFTRRGAVHRITCYADMSLDVSKARKELLDD